MATDKTRYKDVKVRIPEEELAVLNCRVAKTGMSREQYIRCLIADTIPAEYPPADYRLIIRKLDELQEVMEALVDENPVNCNMIDGVPNNTPIPPAPPELDAKPLDKVKEPKERRKGRELER